MSKYLPILIAGLILGSAGIAHAELITNGDFETGDFTGWTLSASANNTLVSEDEAGDSARSGLYFAALGHSEFDSESAWLIKPEPSVGKVA